MGLLLVYQKWTCPNGTTMGSDSCGGVWWCFHSYLQDWFTVNRYLQWFQDSNKFQQNRHTVVQIFVSLNPTCRNPSVYPLYRHLKLGYPSYTRQYRGGPLQLSSSSSIIVGSRFWRISPFATRFFVCAFRFGCWRSFWLISRFFTSCCGRFFRSGFRILTSFEPIFFLLSSHWFDLFFITSWGLRPFLGHGFVGLTFPNPSWRFFLSNFPFMLALSFFDGSSSAPYIVHFLSIFTNWFSEINPATFGFFLAGGRRFLLFPPRHMLLTSKHDLILTPSY